MARCKIFSALVTVLGLIVFAHCPVVLLAGQNDLPHQVHLEFLRGPGMGGDASPCLNCHSEGTPGTGDVNFETCNGCHSPEGAYDGVNDTNLGALHNWENLGSGAEASYTVSMVYDGDVLKLGKEKWCAACHDANSGTLVPAPNVVGDNQTWGYYVSGHKMNFR